MEHNEMIIRTVTGDIAPSALGFCDNHTHTLISTKHMQAIVPQMITDNYEAVLSELKDFKRVGGSAMVDCSTVGQARPTADLVRLSQDSGVAIIASTGFHMPMFYPEGHWSLTLSEQELTDIYINELTTGMYIDCDETRPEKQVAAKAGIIKVACTNKDFDELDQRRFRAAANASIATGASVHCHTDFFRKNALVCAQKILEMGVSPDNVIIAHTDSLPMDDKEIHSKIADMGVYLDFDGFGNPHPGSDRAAQVGGVIKLILHMVGKGYGKQITVGDDMLSFGLQAFGGDGMVFNPTILRRWLRVAGLSEEADSDIFIYNPARSNAMKSC